MINFDLGGIGPGGTRKTVNLVGNPDIHHDFLDLDGFCEDDTVDEFYLSHSLEHVPSGQYAAFLRSMYRKLKAHGAVRVIQSDIREAIRLYAAGSLPFRAMRTVIFTPSHIVRENPLQQHQNMWGAQDLLEDMKAIGFSPVEIFDAGWWSYNQTDELFPGELEKYWGVPIPNLGVLARKPATV